MMPAFLYREGRGNGDEEDFRLNYLIKIKPKLLPSLASSLLVKKAHSNQIGEP
jgi:hypothetical protein